MARFLFCLPRYHTNAIPWVRILQDAGHEVALHVQRVGPVEDHRLVDPTVLSPSRMSVMLGRIFPRTADRDFYASPPVGHYWRKMNDLSPDVVIVRGISRWTCRLAAAVALLQRRRLVVYDQEPAQPRRWSGTWIRRAVLGAFGIPHFTVRRPSDGGLLDRGSARTIPFGARRASKIMANTASGRHRRTNAVPRILMVGKHRSRKGHAVLLTALAQLATRYAFELTLCGEEKDDTDTRFRRSLERQAHELGLAGRTCFKANLDSEAMMLEYAEHDIYVLPSVNEPAAVSPIEAVWSGCAALVDRQSGTRTYLPPEPEYAFDANDPDELAERLERLLGNRETLEAARRACLLHLTSFSSDCQISEEFASFIRPSARGATTEKR